MSGLDKMKKKYPGVITTFNDYPDDIDVISTGSIKLDRAIGAGRRLLGIPMGRVTILWGEKGSGKTSVSLSIVAQAQSAGLTCVYVDVEFALDHTYAERCGVDLEELVRVKPVEEGTGSLLPMEGVWEIIEELARSGEVDLIILDSLDALTPKAEIEGEVGESHVGLKARINAQAMRKIVGPLMINNTALVITGQRRYKIGGWGNPETMSGGQAIQHAASLRVDLSPRKPTKDKDGKPVRQPTRCYIKWSKIAPPSHSATIVVEYGRGICIEEEVLDLGEELEVFEKNGAYYYFTGDESPDAHGSFGATIFLRDHQEIMKDLLVKIRNKLNGIENKTGSREVEEG